MAKAKDDHADPVLVLQGGGALGSYQAGVHEALAEQGVRPRWVAGISIGAINAALIAGNPPGKQVEALRSFWRLVTDGPQAPSWGAAGMARGGARNTMLTTARVTADNRFVRWSGRSSKSRATRRAPKKAVKRAQRIASVLLKSGNFTKAAKGR